MIQIREKTEKENWESLQKSFYHSLTSPFDGMWDELVHEHSQLWGFYDNDQIIGYCSKNRDGQLINFYLTEDYSHHKVELFKRVLFLLEIRQAIVSTNNPDFLVVSLDKSKNMKVHSYLFEIEKEDQLNKIPEPVGLEYTQATKNDFQNLVSFCEKNIDADPIWLENYLKRLLDRNEIFLLKNGSEIVASNEIRKSTTQPKVIDLGVIVDTSYRKKGLGTWLVAKAKQMSLDQNYVPICSCTQENISSKKMIEHAGFSSTNMILKITF